MSMYKDVINIIMTYKMELELTEKYNRVLDQLKKIITFKDNDNLDDDTIVSFRDDIRKDYETRYESVNIGVVRLSVNRKYNDISGSFYQHELVGVGCVEFTDSDDEWSASDNGLYNDSDDEMEAEIERWSGYIYDSDIDYDLD